MALAVCPGSFDPVTNGHLDVVVRAAALFDEVVVLVMTNTAKAGRSTPAQRLDLLDRSLAGLSGPGGEPLTGVRTELVTDGLLADHCARLGAAAIVKGVRAAADVEHEVPMAVVNRALSGVETVLLPADPRLAHISSSLVSEVASLGGDVAAMVPPPVASALAARRRPGSLTR